MPNLHRHANRLSRNRKHLLALAAGGASLSLFSHIALATDTTESVWSPGTTVWSTGTNWNNGLPSSSVSAEFSGTFTNQPTLPAATGETTQGIWVTGSGITGASGLTTINGTSGTTILNITGTATLDNIANAGILLDGTGNNNLSTGSAITSTLLANSTSFIVNNSGTLTLGALNLSSNTLTLGGSSTTGFVVLSGIVSGTGGLNVNTSGTVTISGADTYTGGLNISSGTVICGVTGSGTSGIGGPSANAINLGGGGSASLLGNNGKTVANPINLGTTSGTLTIGNNGSNNAASFSGAIALNGNNLTIGSTGTTGSTTVSNAVTGITGNGNLTISNGGTSTASTTALANNTGTITNIGSGTGLASITTVGSNVTGVTSTNTSPLTITNLASPTTTLTSTGSGLLTVTNAPTGSGNLSLTGNSSGGMTFTNGINNTGTVTSAGIGSGTVTVTGIIGNSVTTVTQNSTGGGTLILNAQNTFTGGLNISGGSVIANVSNTGTTSGATGPSGNAITLGGGGSASLLINGAQTVSNAINLGSTTGTLTLGDNPANTGASSFTGPVTLGTPSSPYNLTIASTGTTATVGEKASISGNGNITLAANSTSGSVSLSGTNINNSGSITNTGSGTGENTLAGTGSSVGAGVTNIIQNSSTSKLLIKGTNTSFAGTVTVEVGTLQIGSGSALNAANAVSVASGATFDDDNSTLTIAGLNNISGVGGTVTNSVSTPRTVTLGGSDNYNFSGLITSATPADLAIAKSGSGTQTFSGTSTYTGSTAIAAGILAAGAINAFAPQSAFSVTAGGVLDTGGFNNTIGSLTVGSTAVVGASGSLNLSYGSVLAVTGAANFSPNLSTGTLNISGTASTTLPEILMTYGSHTGTLTLGSGIIPPGDSLLYTSTALELTVGSSGPASLTWNNTGGAGDGVTWDTTNQNWNNGTGAAAYSDNSNGATGDNVTFNDTNNGHYGVTISGTVNPTSTTFSTNNASGYTIAGANSSSGISGTGSLTLTGSGLVTLFSNNNYSGGTFVNAGTLKLASATAFPANTSLNISSGAQVTIASHGVNPAYVPIASVLSNSGTIDITDNAMIVHNGSIGAITAQVATACNSGAWNGTNASAGVITSSVAAADTTHLTAVGVATGLSSFEGKSASPSDVLIKYTYYGDANLSGNVDGSDYSLIDSTYLNEVTHSSTISGWQNGDFNYDGVVNGSDYTLIDNAFNSQGTAIAAEIATPTAQIAGASSSVPEPTTLGLLGIGALGLLGRRRLATRLSSSKSNDW